MTDIPPAANQPPPPYPQPAPGAYPPPYGGSPYGPHNPYAMAPPAPRNGMGTAGMVLGIISIVLFITSWIAAILGILAIVFSSIGRTRVKQGLATNRGQAKAGLICGIIGTVLGIATLIALAWLLGKVHKCQVQYPVRSPAYNQCVQDTITGGN